jgi:hypothetical protein
MRRSNMKDDTEQMRRAMLAKPRPVQGPQWDTEALRTDFEVIGFLAPFVAVRRKSDGRKGSMQFTHSPRVYFNFVEDNDG